MLSKIVVKGHGDASGKPDVADIGVSVVFIHQDPVTAHRQMDESTGNLLAKLSELGLARTDIRTRYYSVRPEYQRKKDSDVMIGYKAGNALEITVRCISTVSQVVQVLMAAGAKEIKYIQFRCSDSSVESLQREALRKAAANAVDRAHIIAEAMHAEIGSVLRVSDNVDGLYRHSYLRERVLYDAGPESVQPPEEIEIECDVEAVFELRQGDECSKEDRGSQPRHQ